MAGIGLLAIGLICGLSGLLYYRRHGFLWKVEKNTISELEGSASYSRYGGINALVVGLFFLVFGTIALVRSIAGPKDITIEGIHISLPCTYLDIQAMGFDIEEGQEIVEIKGTESSFNRSGKTYTVVDDSGRSFKVRFENDEEEPKLATSCKIYEMTFEYAPPRNIYEGISGYNYLSSIYYEDMGLYQEAFNEAQENYNSHIEQQKEYYENYEILNSPKITLKNNVDSDMTQLEVEAIMGNGRQGAIGNGTSYHVTKEYYMYSGSERMEIVITYVTKDQIAKITISE